MKTRLHPRMVNNVLGDPALYIEIEGRREALLIDCGDLHALEIAALLKITTILISHTHVDHFIGFERIIRTRVGEAKSIRIFGPQGLAQQVRHKFLAYQWNLLERTGLTIHIHEIVPPWIRVYQLSAQDRFEQLVTCPAYAYEQQVVFQTNDFCIQAVLLDHKIPSVGYALIEPPFYNINKKALQACGYAPGPWLGELKQALQQQDSDEKLIKVTDRWLSLAFLKQQLVIETPGQKLAYITDTICDQQSTPKILALAANADVLFCEFYFMNEDLAKARQTHHLTAGQAGELARRAGVKKLVGFHYSPKYTAHLGRVTAQAREAFKGEVCWKN